MCCWFFLRCKQTTSLATGSKERIQEQIVAEKVISTVGEEEVFVAERQLGRMCTEMCYGWLTTAQGRVHSPTAMLWFFILDSLMLSLFPCRSHHIGMESDVTVWDPGL